MIKIDMKDENLTEEIKDETPVEEVETTTPETAEEVEVIDEKDVTSENEEVKADSELAILNDKYLRLCAEYDNFRKRSQKEKDSLYGDIKANVLTSFLPVYDNLERALAAPTEDEAYRRGVEMIMTQFNQTMEKLGVVEIPALGEKFDPNFHNAVMHVDDEEKGENEVVEVFQKGFKIGDKVVRVAMVKVAN